MKYFCTFHRVPMPIPSFFRRFLSLMKLPVYVLPAKSQEGTTVDLFLPNLDPQACLPPLQYDLFCIRF